MSTDLDKAAGTVLMCDPEGDSSVPNSSWFQVFRKPRADLARRSHNVFVLATATCLHEVAAFVTAVNRRHQLRVLFVRSDVDPTWLPQMFELANLRTMRNTIAHVGSSIPLRVLNAWKAGAQDTLIADARVIGESLFILSCEPERYEIPFASLGPLRTIPQEDRGTFTIASDGSYLHWPGSDTHLDLDALLSAIQPERRKRGEALKHAYGERYGSAIAKVRRDADLRQSDVPDLSEREVRRIEAGGDATVDSLRKLAAAHGMTLQGYLDALARLAGVPEPDTHSIGMSRKHPAKKK